MRRKISRYGRRLNEQDEMIQLVDDALSQFSRKTRITLDRPLRPVSASKSSKDMMLFTSPIIAEINTPLFKTIFKEMNFQVEVHSLGGGDYVFIFNVRYTHPGGGSNGRYLGKVLYEDGKFSVLLNN